MAGAQAIDAPPRLPPFRPRAPWWGGDLQTLRNILTRARVDLSPYPERRFELPMRDGSGDRLQAVLNNPAQARDVPLVVLIHGMSGCEDSAYIRAGAAHFLALGYPVIRLNLRGAGPSRATCRGFYYAGGSQDLRDAMAGLGQHVGEPGVVLIGYSLGGNMLIKYLAEIDAGANDETVPRAAATISVPLDLALTARALMRPRNALYQRWLLAGLKTESTAPGAELTTEEKRAIDGARDIPEFDDRFTAPRNGFAGAADYYAHCSAARFIARVCVPTLVIHARDDPWIPPAAYDGVDWAANPHVTLLTTRRGGHVGFHGADDRVPWHDRRAAAFIAARCDV